MSAKYSARKETGVNVEKKTPKRANDLYENYIKPLLEALDGRIEKSDEDIPKNSSKVVEQNVLKLQRKVLNLINQTDWTYGVKEKQIKETVKVGTEAIKVAKNGGKYCDNMSCDCVNHKSNTVDYNSKKYMLTISRTAAPAEEVMQYYEKRYTLKEIAIAQELHKEEGDVDEHLHLYVEFPARRHIRRADYFKLPKEFDKYGNNVVNIKPVKKKEKETVFGYLTKECTNVISRGFDIQQEVHGKLKERDIAYRIAAGEWSMMEAARYQPYLLFNGFFRKFKRFIADVSEMVKDPLSNERDSKWWNKADWGFDLTE